MENHEEQLVLLIDSDVSWCEVLSGLLIERGFRTALAHNGPHALEMVVQLRPRIIVCDLDLPEDACASVIDMAGNLPDPAPVIATSASRTYGSEEVIAVLRKGACDCLIKPFPEEVLLHKIEHSAPADRQSSEYNIVTDFSSFFNCISRLSTSHDFDTLLDISFDYFIQVSRAEAASIYLLEPEKRTWKKMREKKEMRCITDDDILETVRNSAATSGKAFIETETTLRLRGKTGSNDNSGTASLIALPLKTGGEIRGVVILQRSGSAPPFSSTDLQLSEIVALQVGNSFVNATLYENVNQKLLELKIVSSYSEKLMGMVDKYDVIRSLFETAVRYFSMDFLGCLIVQRRTHEFLSWSRHTVDKKALEEFCDETIAVFNRTAEPGIRRRRVIYSDLKLEEYPRDLIQLPALAFRYIVPLCWDDLRFGAIFFGAVREPEQSSGKMALLSSIIGQTRIALTNTRLYGDMKENYIRTIKALAIAVDAKDTYTHGHSENVMNIAEEIAQELSVEEKSIGNIRDAGLLHDIGKIGIPGYVLNKPGPLTYEEFNGIMKTHSILGANIVRDVPFLKNLHKLILYHHEHYDGKGYPDGLKGEQIPLGARILHVADAFEAMTSNRPYRNSLGIQEAIRRLNEASGRQFDPSIIAAFMRIAKRKGWLGADVK